MHLWLGDVVATAGLVLLIFARARTGRSAYGPAAVGAYIGAAYSFTSSTSFANPAVTIARAFTNIFAGIAPGSVGAFVAAQLLGAALAAGLVVLLFPHRPTPAEPLAPADEPAEQTCRRGGGADPCSFGRANDHNAGSNVPQAMITGPGQSRRPANALGTPPILRVPVTASARCAHQLLARREP